LFDKKCPNCGGDLKARGKYLVCPKDHPIDRDKQCFFVSKEKAAEMILNNAHPAYLFLTLEQRRKVDEAAMRIRQ